MVRGAARIFRQKRRQPIRCSDDHVTVFGGLVAGLRSWIVVPDQEANVAKPTHRSEVAIGADHERTAALALEHRVDSLILVAVRDPVVARSAAVAKDRPEHSAVERQKTDKAGS